MEIVNHRQKMLGATESNAQGNDNFATKVTNTENVEKKCEAVRRKNQTYFFSKYQATSLKVTFSGKIIYF